jgi:ribosome-binding factor A
MKKPFRKPRLERILRDALLEVLSHLRDPRLGFYTLTYVELSEDFRHLNVGISVIGSAVERRDTMNALHHAQGYIRAQMVPRLDLRFVPEIHFHRDDSYEKAARIYKIFRSIEGPESKDADT